MELGLQGKVAIITGGSAGIGKATAKRLCEEGVRVTICARRPEVLRQAAEEIEAQTGGEVLAVPADVCRDEQVAQMVQQTLDRFGGVDILVNNAGGSRAFSFFEATEALWREDLEIKLFGAIRCIRAVVPSMRQRGGGRIINITTIGGKAPRPHALPTTVSRAAGINLTKSLASEFAADNILVNTICLGLVKSAQWERRYEALRQQQPDLTLEAYYAQVGQRVPLGRMGEPEEVADLIAFLVSPRAAFITGTAINFDGGAAAVV
ncbi:MAG: short-chain dehydrogenase/reductase [Candidatus Tectimicrobiota bacterium]|nr:MAG: short-chain dehydrogenase/reductase [Candidatus Tectomicrobia bacterium]